MGLLDDIRAESQAKPTVCTIAKVLAELEPKDRADLEMALDDEAVTHTAITRVLTRQGFNMHDKRVANHRNGSCACAR